MPRDASQSASVFWARKFEGSVQGAPKMAPDGAGAAVEIDGFDVFLIGPDIADMGKGEGDDLGGV